MVVLLTDFGLEDEYVGAMKGVIAAINPAVSIVDLCHNVKAQDILWAGLLVAKNYSLFPAETIFLCVVDPTVGSERDIIILKKGEYYFIAPDNGLLSFIARDSRGLNIVKLDIDRLPINGTPSATFQGRDIFAPLAGYLSKDRDIFKFGGSKENIEIIDFPEPKIEGDHIIAKIINIDRFGNLTANIDKDIFNKLGWNNFTIELGDIKIKRIAQFYEQDKDVVALWGSRGLLEIAVPCGCAQEALSLGRDSIIVIKKQI
jgi:S-adenosyl-L-methionine hydrolase (adenosine-forming)